MSSHKSAPFSSHIAALLVVSMVTIGLNAATTAENGKTPQQRPSLVVGIIVEGLSADYVNLLRDNFGPDGFNRFMEQGAVIENVDYGPGVDATAATAILVSGASPSVNGIPAARVWNPDTKSDYPILLDPEKIGSYTESSFTPQPLKVSTIGDEVKIADGGLGHVHSVAHDAQTAIILAGHAGNSGYWLNDTNGKWTSSSYYKDNPQAIVTRNYGVTLASKLDTLAWSPAMALELYPDLPSYKKLYPFRHTFPARERDRFKAFKSSAPGNREVARIAEDYISSLQLGTRGVTDMLCLGFNLSPYLYGRDADNRIETMDAYLRLDSDIANIVKAIEKGPGMGRTVLFIAGTPAPSGAKRDEERWGIPSGQFSPKRATSLLNMYLMAIHGPGDYVDGYYGGYFFLNRKLAKERNIELGELRREAADFLARMSGISSVYTLDDIMSRRVGENPESLRRNISPVHAGDLFVNINPGWEISDGDSSDDSDERSLPVVRTVASISPVYILAPDLEAQTVEATIDARSIAPTVARLLRIRSPNAASLPSLRLSRK